MAFSHQFPGHGQPEGRGRRLGRRSPTWALFALTVAMGLDPLAALARPGAQVPDRVPLLEVRAGQTGYGLTVLSGSRPDTFQVTVLGLQHGARAGGDIILVELSGQDLELSSVARGMSGSPVYLDDGRLLGAIAFGWPGALRPICGLTPAAELDQVRDRPPLQQARATWPRDAAHDPVALLDVAASGHLAARLLPGQKSSPADGLQPPAFTEAWPSPADLARRLLPPPVPGGLVRPDHHRAADLGGQLAPLELSLYAMPTGAAVALGTGSEAGAEEAPPTLVPGSACAIALVAGDGHLGALGTVSLVEDDRVVLMAHPFMQLGPVDLPLASASVVTIFPSRELSFKMGSAGPTVGRITHDQRAGLAGVLGEDAPTLPVSVTVDLPTGGRRTFDFQVALQAELTPTLVFWCLYNALLAEGDDRSQQLVRYDVAIDLQGQDGRPLPAVRLQGVTGGPDGVNSLQSDWQAPLQILLNNRHEQLRLTRVHADLTIEKPGRTARVVALHAPARIAPGEVFTVEVELEPRHGRRWRERFELRAPDSLEPGFLRLGAASAREFFRLDAMRAGGLFEDHSLSATLDLLNRPRALDELTVALIAAEVGFTAAGREMSSLPPSVRHTLAGGPPGTVRPTLAAYLLRDSRSTGVYLQGDAVRDIEVRLSPAPRTEGVRP